MRCSCIYQTNKTPHHLRHCSCIKQTKPTSSDVLFLHQTNKNPHHLMRCSCIYQTNKTPHHLRHCSCIKQTKPTSSDVLLLHQTNKTPHHLTSVLPDYVVRAHECPGGKKDEPVRKNNGGMQDKILHWLDISGTERELGYPATLSDE